MHRCTLLERKGNDRSIYEFLRSVQMFITRPSPSARLWIIVLLILHTAGCTSGYQAESGGSGSGYSEDKIQDDRWIVKYEVNEYGTQETLQTYWLLRAADLTLEQGYDGFTIPSDLLYAERLPLPMGTFRVAGPAYVPIFIPIMVDPNRPAAVKKRLVAEITLLHMPFQTVPMQTLDARKLRAALTPFVTHPACAANNVCPHAHLYLTNP